MNARHLPDADCSLLLSCSRNDIRQAKLRALQRIGTRTIASLSVGEIVLAAAKNEVITGGRLKPPQTHGGF
jgi:hypothetical protein